jgi:hypothetical protein
MKKEFLYNLTKGHGEFEPCVVFAVCSLESRALLFHVLLKNGAQYARVPIHALVHKKEAPSYNLEELEVYDCMSYDVVVNEFDYLSDMRVNVFTKSGDVLKGRYMFTVDWYGSVPAEAPDIHKNCHIIELDNGCYAAQPNNRIIWQDPDGDAIVGRRDYLINRQDWTVENIENGNKSKRTYED